MAQAGIRQGLQLLRKPDFAKLFIAYFITYSGSAMAPIAIAFGVLELTGSTRDSSVVIAAPVIAQIVMLLLGGVLADRTSRQRLMVLAETMAAASQVCIAILFLTGNASVASLALLMLINGTGVALFAPSTVGFITQVVDRGELQSANSLLGAARSSAAMAGAAMAGVLVAAFGAGVAIAIDGVTFLISACLIASVRARAQDSIEKASLITDLRLGWREFISHRWLWTIVVQWSVVLAAAGAVQGLLGPAIAKREMGGALDWGMIAASSGFGTVVGGLVALRLNVIRPILFGTFCCFFFSGTSLALAVPAPLTIVMLAAFVGGVAGQIFMVLWYTALQTHIPSNMLSRVGAYDHLGSIAMIPLGVVVGGILFESMGSTPTMLIAAAAIIVPTALVLLVPDVRQLRSD